MSQAQPQGLGGLAYKSTNDLSGKQFYAVIADTANAGSIIIAGSNALIVGVLQNKPKAGEIAQVQSVRGTSTKVVIGGTVAKGDKLQTKSDGTFITGTGAAQLICAVAEEAGVSGDVIEAVLVDSYVA